MWTAEITLPLGIQPGSTVPVVATASGQEWIWELTFPEREIWTQAPFPYSQAQSIDVVMGTTALDVRFDAFEREKQVAAPPYQVRLTGSVSGWFGTLNPVTAKLNGVSTPVVALNGNRSRWALDLSLPAGVHALRVEASDQFGDTGARDESLAVTVLVEPTPVEQAFAVTSYLKELLALATRRLRIGAATTGPAAADLTTRLRQPFAALVAPAGFAAATAPISQVRVAVEVLRATLTAAPTTALDRRFRGRTYQALLRELGTSYEELRLTRAAGPDARAALAARLGLAADRLAAITISPDTVTDAQLEQVFGYRSTAPADPLAPIAVAQMLLWQREFLQREWAAADGRTRDNPSDPQPVIDPDLIGQQHLAVNAPAVVAALWTQRRAQLDTFRTEVSAGFPTDDLQAGLRAAGVTADIEALAARDAAGEDVAVEAALSGLTLDALRHLDAARRLLDSDTLTEAEWADVVAICVRSRKRAAAAQWREAERAAGVVLAPLSFEPDPAGDAPEVDDATRRWRADPAALAEWRQVLRARRRQVAAVETAYATLLDTVETELLPALRDALLAESGRRANPPQTAAQAAERLSRDLAFDLRAGATLRTTRAGQAVDTLQTLVTAVRTGRLAGSGGATVSIADEAAFDAEWVWLESYGRWRAAIEAFAHPETRLLPGMFRPEDVGGGRALTPTVPYVSLITALAQRSFYSPDEAESDAAAFLAAIRPLVGNLPAQLRLTAVRTDQEIDAHRTLWASIPGSNVGTEAAVPAHLREIFWLVPVALARKLRDSGHYRAALDWYQTVFAFHRPGEQRYIYRGLALEQGLTSSFSRIPDWGQFARELNPHFTARHRRGAYTRFTILSIVECFLDFADAEFARDASDANARALALYQNGADLLTLPEVTPETGAQVPYPENPVWSGLRARAAAGLSKVHAGLNIAGQLDPAAGTGNLLPSPYRYVALLERARGLVASAQQVESAYLGALERADAETYALSEAGNDLRAAQESIVAQDLRVQGAAVGVTQARLQQERAETQRDTYGSWVRGGLNEAEQLGLRMMRVAQVTKAAAAVVALADAWQAWKTTERITASLSIAADAAAAEAEIQQARAGYERREQEWRLSASLAAQDAQIAGAQVAGAQLQQAIAEQELRSATRHLEHASAMAELLATKFTNAELHQWMSGVLGRVYAYLIQQATATAALAQAQLAFERQEPVGAFISADYWRVEDPGNEADRRGLTGSARLLADLVRLDQYAFASDRRRLHLSQTVSVAALAGLELQRFRETGVLTFATPQELFDRDFPGHYLRLIKRVSVSVIALVPPARGLRATLSASGVSRTVVRRDVFETVTLRRDPESIAFTSPVNANGLFTQELEGAMLLPFEGMGVDTVWRLELPHAANPMDLRSVADVLLTLDYTALSDPEYRHQVIRGLDGTFAGDRTISLRNDFPDAWYDLSNPDKVADPGRPMRIDLPLTADDVPRHVDGLRLDHLTAFVVRADGATGELTITESTHEAGGTTVTTGPIRTVGGIAGTRRPNGTPWQSFTGAPPTGRWTFQLEDTPQVRSRFADGGIEDVVFVLGLSGQGPAWP